MKVFPHGTSEQRQQITRVLAYIFLSVTQHQQNGLILYGQRSMLLVAETSEDAESPLGM
jgi:hypothetical protein